MDVARMSRKRIARVASLLESALEPYGFSLGDEDGLDAQFLFVRTTTVPRIYEEVLLDSDGMKFDVAAADARIAVTRGFNVVRGMFERAFIRVPRASDRGWSFIRSSSEQRFFVECVATEAPLLASRLTETTGQQLLVAHDLSLRVANGVVAAAPSLALENLRRNCSDEERHFAQRMREWPAVMCVRGGQDYYEAAALMLLQTTRENHGQSPFLGVDPMADDMRLSRMLQLIVDCLRFGPPRVG